MRRLEIWDYILIIFDDHVSIIIICLKIIINLNFLCSVTRFANLKKPLFIALTFPLLYCDVVLHGMSKGCERKLNMFYNFCIRYIFYLQKYNHVY